MTAHHKQGGLVPYRYATKMFFFLLLVLFIGLTTSSAWTKQPEGAPAAPNKDSKFETDIFVCIIDVTLGSQSINGNTEPLTGADSYDDEFYADGRVAFYLKGKIKGKYLLTMQLDTEEEPLNKLLNNLDKKVFDKIDPDKYYPVYGDQSVIINDISSRGKLYVRLEWDESRVVLGNYQLALNETDLAGYNRSLFGLDVRLYKKTPSSSTKRQGTEFFIAGPRTIHSRDEMRSTGGSLYYLKHGDVVIGSEQLHVEVRDSISGQTIQSYTLLYGKDYSMDYLQGRIALRRNLRLIIGSGLITGNIPLDDSAIYLVADYEFDATGDMMDNASYGLRFNYFLTKKLQMGSSYIREKVDGGNDYQLYGVDFQFDLSPRWTINLERAQSESSPSNRFFSSDGGLTYLDYPSAGPAQTAEAWKVKLNAKLTKTMDLSLAYLFQEKDFANSGSQILNDTATYSLALSGKISKHHSLLLKYDYMDEAATKTRSTSIAQFSQSFRKWTWTEELRWQTYWDDTGDDFEDTLGALRLDYRFSDAFLLFGSHQTTLSQNSNTPDNNRNTIGAEIGLTKKTQLNLETSQGDLGDYSLLGLEYQYSPAQRFYGEYRYDTDIEGGKTALNRFGNRSQIGKKTDFYTERQLSSGTYEDSVSNLYGAAYALNPKWSFTIDYTQSVVDKKAPRPVIDYPYFPVYPDPVDTGALGLVDRNTISLGIFYDSPKLDYRTRLQWRRDEGVEEIHQYVTSNFLEWSINNNLAISMAFKLSFTDNITTALDTARYAETTLGLAYRPVKHDRLNILWEYTFLEEFSPAEQLDGILPGERARVFALDINYDVTKRWQLGQKFAFRRSEIWVDTTGWDHNEIYLWVTRANYTIVKKWDAYIEYRTLWNELADDRKNGFLVAAYYSVSQNTKLGVGYNFTDFNDNLTHLDYNMGGLFVNIIKKW